MRIVLHIGTEKTATTTIQRYFHHNRKAFAELGVLYPDMLCGENHLCLPALAVGRPDKDEVSATAHALMTRQGHQDMETYIRTTLERQVEAQRPEVILFSNEHLHSRVMSSEGAERLRKVLSAFTDDISVIVYLRRQDRLAASYFSTPFKFGKKVVDRPIPAPSQGLLHYYDYGKIVTLWSDVFGRENVIVKIFEEEARSEGGMVGSFLRAAGVSAPGTEKPKTHNESLSLEAIHFLAEFNRRMGEFPDKASELRKLRLTLIHFLERHYPARKKLVPRHEAEAFFESCRETNATVLSDFLPGRRQLFDEVFDEYGGEEVLVPDLSKLAEIGARAAMIVGMGERVYA
ncbi:hypothetical protein FMN50_18385 [Rhodobacterales bacterium]|nr:hypothetical protein FMN50_18385 [Rhodobacterales bacterium]